MTSELQKHTHHSAELCGRSTSLSLIVQFKNHKTLPNPNSHTTPPTLTKISQTPSRNPNRKQISPAPPPINPTNLPNSKTMSAPNQGRQSPDPENQTGAQQQKPPASNPNEQGAAPSAEHGKERSDEQKDQLESNPKGPLEDAAKEKTAKN
ncbi:hypothetical protein ANO11243_060950 [Dothideomycetidae sp. 11243]|nr:hypothetical protein ANO11243_060950 [fungal sp. No.11243]